MTPTLVCVPFAGAGASFFRPWRALAPDLEILAAQLPGRERRIDDPPYRDVAAAADGLYADLFGGLGGGQPVVLFGHSLGAVIAYELAHRLAAKAEVTVAGLLVSGSPGPWTQRERRATGLPDDEFLVRVAQFAGYTHEALAYPEMRELILPVLRADVEMHEAYRSENLTALTVPIHSIRGERDGLVTAAEAGEWSEATTGPFDYVEVDGGHMYLTENARPILRLAATLAGKG
ncbi:thioesterase II family protein [Actinokineospora enzanensis]|uniref:thioesterase II family protein n=1 Tax=Actinokineospora enzanensis TaxID=155975 RepID=UPI00036A8E6E|nr:alpha/beta fold hydrolase [Actinokineospora enzanensis]